MLGSVGFVVRGILQVELLQPRGQPPEDVALPELAHEGAPGVLAGGGEVHRQDHRQARGLVLSARTVQRGGVTLHKVIFVKS